MSTPMLSNWAEKNRPAFWWIYTCLGRGIFTGLFFVYAAQFLMGGEPSLMQRKKGFDGSGVSPVGRLSPGARANVHGGQPGALLALLKQETATTPIVTP